MRLHSLKGSSAFPTALLVGDQLCKHSNHRTDVWKRLDFVRGGGGGANLSGRGKVRLYKLYPGRMEVPWKDGDSHVVRGEFRFGEPCRVVQR